MLADPDRVGYGGRARSPRRWSGSSFAAALLSGAIAAGTQPGRVTARRALQDIRRAVSRNGSMNRPGFCVPPFVPLELLKAEPG